MSLKSLRLSHKLWAAIVCLQLLLVTAGGLGLMRSFSMARTRRWPKRRSAAWRNGPCNGRRPQGPRPSAASPVPSAPTRPCAWFKDAVAADPQRIAALRDEVLGLATSPEDKAISDRVRALGQRAGRGQRTHPHRHQRR